MNHIDALDEKSKAFITTAKQGDIYSISHNGYIYIEAVEPGYSRIFNPNNDTVTYIPQHYIAAMCPCPNHRN